MPAFCPRRRRCAFLQTGPCHPQHPEHRWRHLASHIASPRWTLSNPCKKDRLLGFSDMGIWEQIISFLQAGASFMYQMRVNRYEQDENKSHVPLSSLRRVMHSLHNSVLPCTFSPCASPLLPGNGNRPTRSCPFTDRPYLGKSPNCPITTSLGRSFQGSARGEYLAAKSSFGVTCLGPFFGAGWTIKHVKKLIL